LVDAQIKGLQKQFKGLFERQQSDSKSLSKTSLVNSGEIDNDLIGKLREDFNNYVKKTDKVLDSH
jgi:hypothetical protein